MQFNERTLTILKNFASINQTLVFNPGNELKTINPHKTIMASAKIDDEIPDTACIYDLSRMLSIYSIYKNPSVEFTKDLMIISEGSRKTKYKLADVSMAMKVPGEEFKMPEIDLTIDSVQWDDLQTVVKAAGLLQLPDIAFVGEEGKIYLRAVDSNPKEKSTETYDIELGETNDTFSLVMNAENFKLLPNNYKVSVSSKGISKFESDDVTYYIAVTAKRSSYKKG